MSGFVLGQNSEVLSPCRVTQVVRLLDTAVHRVQLHHVSYGTSRHTSILRGTCGDSYYYFD